MRSEFEFLKMLLFRSEFLTGFSESLIDATSGLLSLDILSCMVPHRHNIFLRKFFQPLDFEVVGHRDEARDVPDAESLPSMEHQTNLWLAAG